ncbi:MAG: 2-succinyl-6-hydroxy-2,4-cyclohexadiene-1-carboxylate synthase [Opitutales bacterium]
MRNLLTIHGFTGSGEDYKALARELGPERRVITLDLPGHGRLTGLRTPDDYSLPAHLARIGTAAGESPVEVLGYSLGGRLALHWALANPTRVTRLVLVGASPGLRTERERRERVLADVALGEFIRSQGVSAFMRYWHGQTMFQTLQDLPSGELDALKKSRLANDPEGLALSLSQVGAGALPSVWDRLHELKMPVDLVTGSRDEKFTTLAREMLALMPRARHGVVEGSGHAVHIERPADLAAAILARRDPSGENR